MVVMRLKAVSTSLLTKRFKRDLIMYKLLSILSCCVPFAVLATDDPEPEKTKKVNSTAEIEVQQPLTEREKRQQKRNETVRSDIIPSKSSDPNRKWEHYLPFFGQQVIEKGYDLPLPFSISIIPNYSKQDLALSNLKLSYKGSKLVNLLTLIVLILVSQMLKQPAYSCGLQLGYFPSCKSAYTAGDLKVRQIFISKFPPLFLRKLKKCVAAE